MIREITAYHLISLVYESCLHHFLYQLVYQKFIPKSYLPSNLVIKSGFIITAITKEKYLENGNRNEKLDLDVRSWISDMS